MGWDPLAVCAALDDGVTVLDGGATVYANPASTRLGVVDLLPAIAEAVERVTQTGVGETAEHKDLAHDRWYRHRVSKVGDRIYIVTSDVTELESSKRRLWALGQAAQAFSRALDLPQLFAEIARSLADIVGDGCVVRAVDHTGTQLRPVALHHQDPETLARYQMFFGRPLRVDEGMAAKVYATGEPLLIAHVDRDALQRSFVNGAHREAIGRSKLHSVIAVPLRDGERCIGTVHMARDVTQRAYTEGDLSLLVELADRAALAIENARVLEAERFARQAAERLAEHTRRLQAIAAQLSHRRPVREIAETVLRESTAVLGKSSAAIWLLDDSGTRLDLLASAAYPDSDRFAHIPVAADIPLAAAVRSGAPVYLADRADYTAQFPASLARVRDLVPAEFATACLPLTTEGRAIGALAFAFRHAHAFVADERTFLEVLANQCAQAIDRSQLLEQERAASQAARAADRRKDEFLAMLGHELRNPLAPILTALELMRVRGERGNERERALIERQTRHLVGLVDDLLDISRITRGKLEMNKRRIDLAGVLARAVEMASPLLEQRGHLLAVSAHRGVLHVEGDELRLAQVFQNLLTNAAKYTPPGGSIGVRAAVDGETVVVEVTDNGEGIASHMLPTIFEPFVQGTRGVDRSQGGLGVGLALVRSLVELHGGSADALSAGPGHGSTFVVRLPLSAPASREHANVAAPRARRSTLRRRILLVDDNRDAAELLAELLRAAGHEVVVAFDGPSALGAVPAFKPEVALLDIGLPVMDGYDLAAKLRTLLPEAARIVALTGYGQEHDRMRSRAAGFAAHLVKPVEAAEVLAAVDEVTSS